MCFDVGKVSIFNTTEDYKAPCESTEAIKNANAPQ